ncbi:MAG TPA: aminotransferase class IV [Stellaceae bacterium]|jgi:branched-chain amino acid aminotransferase|nr:aminotransferase class IV [Stellaceae bacterium]
MSDARPQGNQRVAYFNGNYVPEREVVIPFRDRGFKYGDAAFDMTRTFGGRIFKIEEHVARFYRSLRYLRIDPGLSQAEMVGISNEVLERNRHFLTPDTDFWIGQRVSRGVDAVGDEGWDHPGGPTVIVECIPLPLKARARLFRDGIDIVVPPTRRVSPDMLSPRAKTHNYLNLIMADLEAKSQDKEAWSVLLDAQGHIAEGIGSNIFIVCDGEVLTPRDRFVLPGISRATVIELCAELAIACHEADLDLYDAATADEIFMSSTSLCLCPVRSIGGRAVPGPIPGPITRRLTEAYARSVGCDFVAQYLKHLG